MSFVLIRRRIVAGLNPTFLPNSEQLKQTRAFTAGITDGSPLGVDNFALLIAA
jgi:hypothetical protein